MISTTSFTKSAARRQYRGVFRQLSLLTTTLLSIGFAFVFGLVGCASSTGVTHYAPTHPVPISLHAFEDELMTYSAPAKPFTVTGQFQSAGYETPDASLARMREYAAALGLDGVALIRCNLGKLSLPKALGKGTVPETVVESAKKGDCAGQGFVWVSR
jgi:hypothetical protein